MNQSDSKQIYLSCTIQTKYMTRTMPLTLSLLVLWLFAASPTLAACLRFTNASIDWTLNAVSAVLLGLIMAGIVLRAITWGVITWKN